MRKGFTLVELLTVIVVIGTLAGLSLGALYAARESARASRTQAAINKLDSIVQARYAEYAARRVPLDSRQRGVNHGLLMPPPAAALARLQMLRYLMKMEMPDHLSDVTYPAGSAPSLDPANIDATHTLTVSCDMRHPQTGAIVTERWQFQVGRTALARQIYGRCQRMSEPGDNNNAELFYLWVRASDPESIEQFGNDVGDVDDNGFFEFLDGWGRPIKFLRWPSGFEGSELMTGDYKTDHDPLDTRTVDKEAFRLIPLIWSNGADGLSGLDLVDVAYAWETIYSNKYGKPVDVAHHEYGRQHDNIDNHRAGR